MFQSLQEKNVFPDEEPKKYSLYLVKGKSEILKIKSPFFVK